jgi:hypothetical protein
MNEKTWQRNAPSQITLNSIFAALVAVLIAIVIQDKDIWVEKKMSLDILNQKSKSFTMISV